MLTSAFDPFLVSRDIPPELDLGAYVLLTRNDHQANTLSGPDESTVTANPETGPLPPPSDLPDGDTIEVFVPSPVSARLPSDQPDETITNIDRPLLGWPPSPSQSIIDDESGDHYLRASSLGLTGRTISMTGGDIEDADQDTKSDDMDSGLPSASLVRAVPCGEHGSNAHTTLCFDIDTRKVQRLPVITRPASSPVTRNGSKSREVFDSVIVPVPLTTKTIPRGRSSQPDVINKANDILAVAMKKPRRWSDPQARQPASASEIGEDTFAMRFFSPPAPTPPARSSTSSTVASSFTSRAPRNQHIHIKTEFSPSPASSSVDLEAQIKTLESALRNKTTLLVSHNTMLDTISPRLNTMLSTCNVLAQKRKSLLDERKTLQFRISANYQDLKETKVKAQRLEERQAEVMDARDKAQYGLDNLMQERRALNKALANKRLDEALMAKFPDRGARELARQVGWQPRPVHNADGKEHDVIELSDDESDDDRHGSVDKRPEWLRIADAFIDGDQSVDFADLTGLQEGLESIDKTVKQEQDGVAVKIESSPPIIIEEAISRPSTAEKSDSAQAGQVAHVQPATSQTSVLDEILREPGIEDDIDLPTGEITLEKLQAHFKAMEEHKKEAAKMLRMLAGVQRGTKRKEGPGSTGHLGKKRRLGLPRG